MPRPARHIAEYIIRCEPEQRRAWQEKAAARGISLAAWIRETLDSVPTASISYTTVSNEKKLAAIDTLIRLLEAERATG